MTAVAHDPPPSPALAPEARPVAVGYASPFPAARPAGAPWVAVTACLAGLVLLGLALGALVSAANATMIPQGARRAGPLVDVVPPLLVVFGIVCSLAGSAFLAAGFRSLLGSSRSE